MVEKQKRGKHRYNIFINDEYAFSVHEDIMIKHRLLKGETIDPEQMLTILRDEERNKAYTKALGMIGRRPHSSSEVKRKLKEHGFEQPIIQWTIDTLEQQNYINDEDFAKMWMEHRIYTQRKGRNLVRQELQQKGIHKELVQGAMQTIDPDEELEGALKVARTKWKQTSGEMIDKKRKTAAFLMRRGYTGSVVSKVLTQLGGSSNDEEYEEFADSFDY
ncbi:RecX family transcriptional regulator [Paenibacillus sp. WST5]|uniref:Regulatory protein RecX n=2 Tax=Paenibacillus sedimenti TaxID=2770274 RepID=A0A926KNL8_9BACL|nr:RecX family transcriptional regulator [Paenibacillus sedimenti]